MPPSDFNPTSPEMDQVMLRIIRDNTEYLQRKDQYAQWGESLAVMLANTVHTTGKDESVVKREMAAKELFQIMGGDIDGNDLVQNGILFPPAVRDRVVEFGKYAGDKKITEQELIRVYIGY